MRYKANNVIIWYMIIPSGKLLHNYGTSPFSMGKSTISMAMFNSKLLNGTVLTQWMEWGAVFSSSSKPPKKTCELHHIWLVVLTILKNIKSVGIIIPNVWKHKKCSKPPTRYYIGLNKALRYSVALSKIHCINTSNLRRIMLWLQSGNVT